ncbi:MAG: hypothetical protein ABW042_04440 [Phenylobacterium sp.]
MRRLAWMAVAAALVAGPAPAEGPLAAPTQKLSLKPHRIKGQLLGYGYDVGEFTGEVRTRASSTRAVVFEKDAARTVFTIAWPANPEPVTATCAGGESHMQLGWIQFNTRDLKYVCRFENGPPDADFALALSAGSSVLGRLQQPQRAAQLTFGGRVLRAETHHVSGALPIGGGRTLSYKITREDGTEVAALVRGVLQPTFYLPPEGSPDRDAAAVMALALFFFADPADRQD